MSLTVDKHYVFKRYGIGIYRGMHKLSVDDEGETKDVETYWFYFPFDETSIYFKEFNFSYREISTAEDMNQAIRIFKDKKYVPKKTLWRTLARKHEAAVDTGSLGNLISVVVDINARLKASAIKRGKQMPPVAYTSMLEKALGLICDEYSLIFKMSREDSMKILLRALK